jgi:hypothetical protein
MVSGSCEGGADAFRGALPATGCFWRPTTGVRLGNWSRLQLHAALVAKDGTRAKRDPKRNYNLDVLS